MFMPMHLPQTGPPSLVSNPGWLNVFRRPIGKPKLFSKFGSTVQSQLAAVVLVSGQSRNGQR